MMDETRISKMGEDGDLIDIVRLTALNVNGISEQMGVVVKTINTLRSDVAEVKSAVNDLNDRVIVLEEDEALKPYQVYNVKKAVRVRVAELLKVKFDKRGGATDDTIGVYHRYYGKFCGRLHNDAKCAGIEETAWRFTPRKNYQKLIEFIADWTPARGVKGLMAYYDALEADKS